MIEEIMPNKVYNYAQTQKLLGIGWRSIRKLVATGALKPKEIARSYMFTGQMILDFLNSK